MGPARFKPELDRGDVADSLNAMEDQDVTLNARSFRSPVRMASRFERSFIQRGSRLARRRLR